ncbi:MAG: hypothetical protein JXB39_13750 [Deltaproteobacteria bacterium]|nr:hypothetical protein [Deltaproteobacteria bacterium]
MIDLPQEMRDLLVEQLDEYIEGAAGSLEPESLAQEIVDRIQGVGEDCEVEAVEDIVAALETSGDLDASLMELLTEQLEQEDLEDLTGEDLVAMVEKVCEIEWSDEDAGTYGVEELDDELDFDGEAIEDMEEEY